MLCAATVEMKKFILDSKKLSGSAHHFRLIFASLVYKYGEKFLAWRKLLGNWQINAEIFVGPYGFLTDSLPIPIRKRSPIPD